MFLKKNLKIVFYVTILCSDFSNSYDLYGLMTWTVLLSLNANLYGPPRTSSSPVLVISHATQTLSDKIRRRFMRGRALAFHATILNCYFGLYVLVFSFSLSLRISLSVFSPSHT